MKGGKWRGERERKWESGRWRGKRDGQRVKDWFSICWFILQMAVKARYWRGWGQESRTPPGSLTRGLGTSPLGHLPLPFLLHQWGATSEVEHSGLEPVLWYGNVNKTGHGFTCFTTIPALKFVCIQIDFWFCIHKLFDVLGIFSNMVNKLYQQYFGSLLLYLFIVTSHDTPRDSVPCDQGKKVIFKRIKLWESNTVDGCICPYRVLSVGMQ